ncbi:MAG: hypothetical protein ACR2KI_08860 [Candidatus Limnocylindria bacterium]
MSLLVAALAAGVGTLLLLGGTLTIRATGAQLGLGRRFAGARELPVGELLDLGEIPARPVRVVGRIRAGDPLQLPEGERLVVFHRDVEIHAGRGRWRTVERLRETRSFDLWDHDGSLPLDPARAAEPLVVIPEIWRGTVNELDVTHRRAAERLVSAAADGIAARAITRTVNIVDRLRVLAIVRRSAAGALELAPPPGGYVISNLEVDEAIRVLGGPRRELIGPALVASFLGAGLLVAALGAAIGGLLAR